MKSVLTFGSRSRRTSNSDLTASKLSLSCKKICLTKYNTSIEFSQSNRNYEIPDVLVGKFKVSCTCQYLRVPQQPCQRQAPSSHPNAYSCDTIRRLDSFVTGTATIVTYMRLHLCTRQQGTHAALLHRLVQRACHVQLHREPRQLCGKRWEPLCLASITCTDSHATSYKIQRSVDFPIVHMLKLYACCHLYKAGGGGYDTVLHLTRMPLPFVPREYIHRL